MPEGPSATLFVDIGNTSISVGKFAMPDESSASASDWWQTPLDHWQWRPDTAPPWESILSAANPQQENQWVVASVNRDISRQLQQDVRQRCPSDQWQSLQSEQFPIETTVKDKSAVGADRLAAVVAANAWRQPGRAAVVVDAGSAINVELVDENGVFHGGAILPGMAMAARALAVNTDLLPTVTPADSPPEPVGRDTNEAIRSGLYWGAWGAIGELVERITQRCAQPPHLMFTGGGILWRNLREDVEVHPFLVLSGIALAWRAR